MVLTYSKYLKRIVSAVILFGMVILIFGRYAEIARYPRTGLYDFYNKIEKDTVDVLCVGSSHVYCSINPVQMYDDYGIAAYDLSAGSQAIWYSYYFILEALKTQKPDVVILDVYTVIEPDGYFDKKIEGNLLNMKPSYTKYEALRAADADDIASILFEFPITHSRYKQLQKEDYSIRKNNGFFLGYLYETRIVPYSKEQITDVRGGVEMDPISRKAEEYLRKTIERMKKDEIDLILVNAPWPNITEGAQKKYNYVQKIADEYGIPFLNGCLYTEEIGLDYTVDSMGDGGHLNYTGAAKYTRWLCNYLKENYELPDRRIDDRYAVWQQESEKLNALMRKNNLATIDNIYEYVSNIQSDEIYYVITMDGNNGEEGNDICEFLSTNGIDIQQDGICVMNGNKEVFCHKGEDTYQYYQYFGDSVLYVYEEEDKNIVLWNDRVHAVVENGFNIFAYDCLLDEVIATVGFDADNGYIAVR